MFFVLTFSFFRFCFLNFESLLFSSTLNFLAGDFESPPILLRVSPDSCVYELEWYTAAACVLSKTQQDNCKVEDPQAGTTQTHQLVHGHISLVMFSARGRR